MNPPPSLFPIPFGEHHGCHGDGCASDRDTWPLYDVLRRGVPCRLCCSCILLELSHRSLYCCRCFFLVTTPSNYDEGDELQAPPAPTITCVYCCRAVAHLSCLYQEEVPVVDGVFGFVCPPCAAAQNGRPFTYAPPCRQPLDMRAARVVLLAGRIAAALLQRQATAARANAERLAREARDAREKANEALSVACEVAKQEDPSWVLPQSSEEEGNEAEASVGEVLLVRRNVMASLGTLTTIGEGSSVVPMAVADAMHTPPSSQPKLLFDLNKNAAENDLDENILNEKAAENAAEAVQAEPVLLNTFTLEKVPLNSLNVKAVAMAAVEAARASLPTPPTLPLFPGAKASSSTMMPRTKKPRTKRPRTLQLFMDGEKKM